MSFWNKALDKSVVFSFDRTGYNRHKKRFVEGSCSASLSGKNFLVTGGNSGIGFAAVEQLAARDATVLLACRSLERGEAAIAAIKGRNPDARLELRQVDMADLPSVSNLGDQIEGPLHGIIHNAGNMVDECQYTDAKIEYITSLHVAGPYILSLRLQKQLGAGGKEGGARIIFVASGGMYTQGLSAKELFNPSGKYDGMRHYAHTKRAQVVLADQLHKRLKPHGIAVHSMHPGWVDTPSVRRAMPKFTFFTKGILRAPEEGADTISWLAGYDGNDIDEESGFWFDRERAPLFMGGRVSVPPVEIDRMMKRLDEIMTNST